MQSTQFTSHQGPPSSIKDDFFTTETYANLATKNHNRSIFHFSQSVTTADLKLLANRSANKCRNAQSVRKERYLEGTKKVDRLIPSLSRTALLFLLLPQYSTFTLIFFHPISMVVLIPGSRFLPLPSRVETVSSSNLRVSDRFH